MNLDKIFENNRDWIAAKQNGNEDFFSNLAKGQSPAMLYIGCCDSRVTAEAMMGMKPGEAFVHRNIANMVSNLDLGVMSTINYAIEHLKVEHVVVCGHYGCGGVKAAMQIADLGILNPWLREVRDVFRLHKNELDAVPDEEARYRRLVELNVQEQCLNVLKTVEAQRARRDRNLQVHGWVFDIGTGRLKDLDIDVDGLLEEISEVYHVA
ncbi:MAG: carbonic anhydrase [Pirellulaceae bacterium]|nr:carbonic anhydrase [Pirellulaceae bacterium]